MRTGCDSLSLTVLVPGERIAQFLPFDLHVQSNGHQIFRLLRIVDGRRGVCVIETSGEETKKQARDSSRDERLLQHTREESSSSSLSFGCD